MADRCAKSTLCGVRNNINTVDDLQKVMQEMIRETVCTRAEVSGYLMATGAWSPYPKPDDIFSMIRK